MSWSTQSDGTTAVSIRRVGWYAAGFLTSRRTVRTLLECHPDFRDEVSDDELVEGSPVADNFFQLLVESNKFGLITG